MANQHSVNKESSSNSNSVRKNVYFSQEAINCENQIAKELDGMGFAVYKQDGSPNRSAIVNALYLLSDGKKHLIAKKHA